MLYQLIQEHYPAFVSALEANCGRLPSFVRQEFDDYHKCGLLQHGFLRVKCDGCRNEHLVAISFKRRGSCPSCGARRMVESAAHLRASLPVGIAAERLARFFAASVELMTLLARATGHRHLGDLTVEDLTTFKTDMAQLTSVAYGGVVSA